MFDKVDMIQYGKGWLQRIKQQVDTITYQGYKQHLEKHIIPYFTPMKLSVQDVTTSHIDGYYQYKSTAGRLDGKDGGLCRASIKRHSVVLNMIFEEALKNKLIKENPCRYAKIPKQNENIIKQQNYYNVKQCEKLLKSTEGTILHDMILVTFLYGLRRSELMGLRWCDVDFDNNTLTVQHTVVVNKVVVRKDKTKNKTSNRVYPLLDDVKEILLKLQQQQEEYRQLFGACYSDTGYIFTKENGEVYYPDYPSKRLKKVLESNNLPPLNWHGLRHACASMLIVRGWHMKDISNWLGHADISTTMNIYGHIDMEHKRMLGNDLSGIF